MPTDSTVSSCLCFFILVEKKSVYLNQNKQNFMTKKKRKRFSERMRSSVKLYIGSTFPYKPCAERFKVRIWKQNCKTKSSLEKI